LAIGVSSRKRIVAIGSGRAAPAPDAMLAILANRAILGTEQQNSGGFSMPTRNINLTEHYDQFIEEQVASGQFKNASEVTRAALRLLEQHGREEQEKLLALRALAAQGFDELDQGRGIVLDGRDQLADFIGHIGRQAATRARTGERGSSKGPAQSQRAKRKKPKSPIRSGARRSAENP
jgi:antitoxin ParD1/3/4